MAKAFVFSAIKLSFFIKLFRQNTNYPLSFIHYQLLFAFSNSRALIISICSLFSMFAKLVSGS